MSNKIQDAILQKSSLTMPKIYNYFLYIGFFGLCSANAVLVLDWMIFPQYITSILADAVPQVSWNMHFILGQLHSIDMISFISIGLGFFAVLGRNNVKERYLFLLIFLFPAFQAVSFYDALPGGYLIYDATSLETFFVDHLLAISLAIIVSYLLFNSRFKISESKLVVHASLLLVITEIVPFALYFVTGPLRLHYDEVLHQLVGSLVGPFIIIGLSQITAIIGIIVYGFLFVRELRRKGIQSEESARLEEGQLEPIHN